MRLYVSTTGTKRIGASRSGVGGTWKEMKLKNLLNNRRRLYSRLVILLAVVLFGLALPLFLLRTAFLVLESAAFCSSAIGCMATRLFGGSDTTLLREELTKAFMETIVNDEDNGGGVGIFEDNGTELVSFKDLVKNMASNEQDIKAFAFKTKAMITKMENKLKSAKWQESIYWHLAAHGVPKNLRCLSLKFAEEYSMNAEARSRLPSPQYVYHLTDNSFHHFVLLTDNILAASVVISSAIKTSINPENSVFHIITDKKTYPSMHAWFALNTVDSVVVEVKGLHQYDWSHDVNVKVKEMLDIHHQIFNSELKNLKQEGHPGEDDKRLGVLRPSFISLLNHLRIYLPELFPNLDKVVFLDDDVIVQRDLSSLWELNLDDKVVGAVADARCGIDCCPGRKYKDYFNFTNPIISSNLNRDRCGWLPGMTIFDFKAWRKTNITAVYHQWLKLNLDSGYTLWHPGVLPPTLLAFENHVHYIDSFWQMAGLGDRDLRVEKQTLESSAVIHFSGPAKPWLEIASPESRHLWNRYINSSHKYIRRCGIAS